MKFSIITVAYNSELLIGPTLESLERQHFRDLEWVFVDGASSDATRTIGDAFEAFPKTVLSEPDKGIYDAMNKAVGLARGDYLYFLNCGDAFADETVLQDVARFLDDARQPDLLSGDALFVGVAGRVKRSFAHINRRSLFFDSLCHQAVFARRGLFQNVGLFDTTYRYSADYEWLIRCMKQGARLEHLPRLICHFDTDGAHVQAAARTRLENLRARAAHASPLFLRAGTLWYRGRHYLRRIVGLPTLGHHALSEREDG